MRRDRWSRTNRDLCDAHQGLNAILMNHLFKLVRREVGHHLRKFDAYPDLLKPLDTLILQKLQAIRGMWEKPDQKGQAIPEAWSHEISCCQGCMVARVASDKNALRNLRIALLARTQTRLNHAPRRLMKFVDTCIDLFPDYVDELYGTSSQFAFILKDTRKACSKAWAKDPAHADSRPRRRRHTHHDKSDKNGKGARNHRPASEYNPRNKYVQPPPPIISSHPTERQYRPTSSPSRKAPTSAYHMKRDRRSAPNPDRVTRFMDFADDDYQGLGISEERQGVSTVYGPLRDSPSPSTGSTFSGTLEKIDEVLEMYKDMGKNSPVHGNSVVPPECRSPSICSTDSEWSDEAEDRSKSEGGSTARATWNMVCEQSNMI
ncbi:hypothetical protein PENVUL_c019G04520 [Penicillium vulpinum]|uniref:Uncharacterized protein n=1 Tax=Penicillium vulpinum TaxID=29845 RepID=A0A1V6RXZ2_9EURO|nr:hypothetical protein PENVUL_c019G04520 [Penicillium vulpinum]